MKKTLVLVTALTLILGLVTFLWAREGGTPGIYGTPHDVQVITGEAGLEPCAMCHSPHSGTGQYPLWNRDQGPQSYTMYRSPSFDMAVDAQSGPAEPSSLCLVCHNGVFSSLVNYPGPGSHSNENYDYEMNPTFWAMLDMDLSNEHPISFTYDPSRDNLQDNNGFPIATQCPTAPWRYWILGANGAKYPLYGADTTAATDQFECSTCHAVHDTVAYPGKQMVGGKSVGSQVFFLRSDNSGSKMCADCHVNRL
ncbi:MAG: hypothetical protein AB1552_10690 [Nitrospirota bacterium]